MTIASARDRWRILLVSRDVAVMQSLSELAVHGCHVRQVDCGACANEVVTACQCDLILLDIDTPNANGTTWCCAWSRAGSCPIVILTAGDSSVDRVHCLRAGADDCIAKPFDVEEVAARIRTVLRRVHGPIKRIVLGTVVIDFVRLKAWRQSTRIHLTYRECAMLRYLAERRAMTVTREDLLRDIWGYSKSANTRAVDHAVAKLRRKIEADSTRPAYLRTVHGGGYSLTITGKQDP